MVMVGVGRPVGATGVLSLCCEGDGRGIAQKIAEVGPQVTGTVEWLEIVVDATAVYGGIAMHDSPAALDCGDAHREAELNQFRYGIGKPDHVAGSTPLEYYATWRIAREQGAKIGVTTSAEIDEAMTGAPAATRGITADTDVEETGSGAELGVDVARLAAP